jgi:hypothetical protein
LSKKQKSVKIAFVTTFRVVISEKVIMDYLLHGIALRSVINGMQYAMRSDSHMEITRR